MFASIFENRTFHVFLQVVRLSETLFFVASNVLAPNTTYRNHPPCGLPSPRTLNRNWSDL